MKAAVIHSFGTEDVLKVEDVNVPKFSEQQILVKVKAAGINLVDTFIRAGAYEDKPALPAILGKEISGTVEELGGAVTTFKKGDRVYCGLDSGGYAEYAVANISRCHQLREKISFSRGAALYVSYFAAYRALVKTANLKKEESVLIHDASGGLGTASVQIANCIGALICASVATPALRNIVTKAGANIVTNHTEYPYLHPALYDNNMQYFDVIAEVMQNPKLKRDQFYLSPKGRIVVFTNNKTIDLDLEDMPLFKAIKAVSTIDYDDEVIDREAEQFVDKCVINGKVAPFIAYEHTLEDIVAAHKELIDKEEEKGKRVILF